MKWCRTCKIKKPLKQYRLDPSGLPVPHCGDCESKKWKYNVSNCPLCGKRTKGYGLKNTCPPCGKKVRISSFVKGTGENLGADEVSYKKKIPKNL